MDKKTTTTKTTTTTTGAAPSRFSGKPAGAFGRGATGGASAGGYRGGTGGKGGAGTGGFGGSGGKGGDRGPRKPGFNREKSEFDQKILAIRRVTRVVSGGRRMSFSVAMVIGDRKGSFGIGTGKAIDTALAIAKALKQARKKMVTIKLTKTSSIPHDVKAKFSSSRVFLMPNSGRGVVAGSAIRDIIALAGIKNITAKVHSGSKNKLNIAKATMEAFAPFSRPYKGASAFSADPNVGSAVLKDAPANMPMSKEEKLEAKAE